MNKIIEILNKEDKRNPFTDIEIAEILNISRAEVIKLRRSLNIEDSRDRRKPLLEKDINEILSKKSDISQRNLTVKLNEIGYDISRNAIAKIFETLNISDKDKEEHEEINAFEMLIGSDGSLKPLIELAKAAVLYPPKGLHALIYGPTGVGKSELAECMHKFAIESGVKKASSPFIVFNCADYSDNPQLLLSQLFGYVKGAFTGADNNKDGMVQKSDGGILFLDEIHRLPPEGQEILFYLIDKGKYRRLGETDVLRDVEVMIIGATTENLESSLLSTFRRRIPMLIELPSLMKRPLEEKYEIIKSFFKLEAARINAKIVVSYDAVAAMLLYEAKGNVGQLRSDIQVACARAFLDYVVKKEKYMYIDISHVSSEVAKGILDINKSRKVIEQFIKHDLEIMPDNSKSEIPINNSNYMLPKDIYKDIEDKYQKLELQNVDIKIINRIIGDDIERKVQQLVRQMKGSRHTLIRQDLEKIVGKKIVKTVESMIKKTLRDPENADDTLFYCLATHLAAAYERILQNKHIVNPQLEEIKLQSTKEYTIASNMAKIAETHLNIKLPEDEVAFIAMYLKFYTEKDTMIENNVGIMVLSHGHVAEGMANVANRLLGEKHANSFEMSLDQSPQEILIEVEEKIKSINRGKGVLILVDMGSLVSFGKIISERTGIPIRTCTRVNTIMVIEAVRKSLLPESNLNEIADSLEKEIYTYQFENIEVKNYDLKPLIIFTCLTGEGTALALKNVVIEEIPRLEEKVQVINQGSLTKYDIGNIIGNRKLIAVVGSINPKYHGIPFISASEIIKGTGIEKIKNFLNIQTDYKLKDLIYEDLIFTNVEATDKFKVFNSVNEILYEKGYVTKNFEKTLIEREEISPTIINKDLAVPHGNPDEVIKQAIVIIKLKNPILWDDNNRVKIIFMLLLKEYQKDEFRKLYRIINDEKLKDKLLKLDDAKAIKEVIINES